MATDAERDELFGFLTANEWSNTDGIIRLRRGGGFWRQQKGSDFVAPIHEGNWSLHAYGRRSGAVFLGDQTLMQVARSDDGRLIMDFVYFDVGAPIGYMSGEASRGAAGLPSERLPTRLRPLLNVCWRKANGLNLDHEAEFISFAPDGHFRASFRDGNCLQDGVFGFDEDQPHPLLSYLGDKSCSVNGQGPSGLRVEPVFLEDLLLLDGRTGELPSESHARVFRRADGDQSVSIFVRRGLNLEIVGSYLGNPIAGQAWRLRLSIKNVLTAVQLRSIDLNAEALSAELQPTGVVQSLYQNAINLQLANGETHVEESTGTFPMPGFLKLILRIDAVDARSGGALTDPSNESFFIQVAAGPTASRRAGLGSH